MSRASKFLLFYGTLLVALFDIHAIASRLFHASPPPIAWGRVGASIFIQVVVLALTYAYLCLIARGRKLELPPFGSFDSWRVRYAPVGALAAIAAFAVAMLYSGLICSDKPFPSRVRGEQCL